MDLQHMRYSNDMCSTSAWKMHNMFIQHILLVKEWIRFGEAALFENNAKFVFKQHSEPRLALRKGNMIEAIELPRYPGPKVKQNRGLRKIKNLFLGKT